MFVWAKSFKIKCKHRSLLMLKFIYLLKKSKRFGVIRSPSSVDKNVKKLYNLC